MCLISSVCIRRVLASMVCVLFLLLSGGKCAGMWQPGQQWLAVHGYVAGLCWPHTCVTPRAACHAAAVCAGHHDCSARAPYLAATAAAAADWQPAGRCLMLCCACVPPGGRLLSILNSGGDSRRGVTQQTASWTGHWTGRRATVSLRCFPMR